ncbi:MAG: copper amine oxidase N-terminal domain-containing protein [Ruminiclostridium sp.]|nr:copper amine oxidase N-terminal domain-containing protein [Ruminiclostridium sp.]
MKKAISIALSILMVLSLVFVVYASGNGNGKIVATATPSPSPTVTPTTTPSDTLEGLTEQLKANHADKALRKILLNKIKALRKHQGDKSIPVLVNGKLIKFDVPPVIKRGRTLIPVRAVSNALGATVAWDSGTPDIVTITKDVSVTDTVYSTITVVIHLDTGKFYKDGVLMDLDVPAQLISNRTFVPIRFLAEIFGKKVDWDKDLDGVVVDDDDEDEDKDKDKDKD